MTHSSTEAHLRAHDAFQNLPQASFAALAAAAREVALTPGEDLLREGDTGRDVFLILEGEAEAYRTAPDGGAEISLNRIGAGDCVGELSVIDGSPRAASVRATRPTRAIRIAVDDLDGGRALADLRAVLAAVAVARARALSTAQLQSLRAQLDARVK